MDSIELIKKDKSVVSGIIFDDRFKTNQISVFFEREISKKDITKLSLLFNMMRTGTIEYPTHTDMAKREEELYGLSLGGSTTKKGNKLVGYFKVSFISDKYIDRSILDDAISYLDEIIFNPLIAYAKSPDDIFLLEKQNLKNEIEAKINDKIGYAQDRCLELMFENHPFSIPDSGYIDDIDSISQEDLKEIYKDLLSNSKKYIIFSGDFEKDSIQKILGEKLAFDGDIEIEISEPCFDVSIDKTVVEENMGTTQGKLVIGYTNGINRKDTRKRFSYMVANSILGGGAHSLLFNNVREKESMCYYISSSPDKYMQITLIQAGIEIENYERALELIRKEVEKVRMGDFTDEDISTAKKYLVNARKSMADSISSKTIIDFDRLSDDIQTSFDEETAILENVTKEEIMESFQDMKEEIVYFLS